MVALNNLQDLLLEQLKDIYHAENQLLKALPKMAKAAHDPQLKNALEKHLEETQHQVIRLERIFEHMGQKASTKTCYGMKGLIEEGQEAIKSNAQPAVQDAEIIAAAQRVEHYEIAAYGTVRTFAEHLGDKETARLLQETLNEEAAADKKLTAIAESNVNVHATSGA